MSTTATMTAPAARKMPWDVMGKALATNYSSTADALADRDLDFTVDMRPLVAMDVDDATAPLPGLEDLGTDDTRAVPAHRACIRPFPDGTRRVIGVTGNRYTPIPNTDAFSVADVLTAEWGATITGAADFHGGNASLLVVTLPDAVKVTGRNGEDTTVMNLVMKNSHDGSSALTFALTGIRLACTNALQAHLASAPRVWKVSHTPNAITRVTLAHDAILKALTYHDAFQEKAQAMMDQAMVDAEFEKMLGRLWPVSAEQAETKAGANRLAVRQDILGLYHTSPTLDTVRGTRWGGYNALTEWTDWGRPVRKGDTYRAQGSLEGAPVKMKERVWDLFSAGV